MKGLARFVILVFPVLLLAQAVSTQTEDSTTDGKMNGVGWISWGNQNNQQVSDVMRGMYLLGLSDGLSVHAANILEAVHQITKMYEDPANMRLPIAKVYPTVAAKLAGTQTGLPKPKTSPQPTQTSEVPQSVNLSQTPPAKLAPRFQFVSND
jgi:hypothetical protein